MLPYIENGFELAVMSIGFVGLLQLLLALIVPTKWKWIAILLIPALFLILAGFCFAAAYIVSLDAGFGLFLVGLLLVAGFICSLPFALIGYFLQKLKVRAAPQESTNA